MDSLISTWSRSFSNTRSLVRSSWCSKLGSTLSTLYADTLMLDPTLLESSRQFLGAPVRATDAPESASSVECLPASWVLAGSSMALSDTSTAQIHKQQSARHEPETRAHHRLHRRWRR